MSRVLLVAQAPSRAMVPGARPFDGAPVLGRFAGYLGVEPAEVYELFDIVNLIDEYPGPAAPGSKYDAFPLHLAREGARRVRRQIRRGNWCRVVTVGRASTGVFWGDRRGFGKMDWFEWYLHPQVDLPVDVEGSCSPHPGGTSMFWNNPSDRQRGIEFWRSVRDYARGS